MLHVFKTTFSSTAYKKMFWRYYLRICCIFVLILLAVAVVFSVQVHKQNRQQVEQAAQSLSRFSKQLLNESQNIAFNVGRSDSLLQLAQKQNPQQDMTAQESTLLFNAQHELVSFKALNRHISSIGVELEGKDYIISDHGTINLESFCRSVFNTSTEGVTTFLSHFQSSDAVFVPPATGGQMLTPLQPLYVLPLTNSSGTAYGTLFLFLDDGQLTSEIRDAVPNEMEYFVFGKQNRMILSSSVAAPTTVASFEQVLQTNPKYANADDPYSGWHGYVGYTDAFLHQQMVILLILCFAVFAVGMVVLVPVTHRICTKEYAPIRELSDLMKQKEEAQTSELEYETLKHAVNSVLENKALLEQQMTVYKPLLINSFLLELLDRQNQDCKNAVSALANLGIQFPFDHFRCVAVQANKLPLDFWHTISRQTSREEVVCAYVAYQKDWGIFLLNCADQSCEDWALKNLEDLLRRENAVTVYGVGSRVKEIEHAQKSCSQALCALEYLPLKISSKGIYFDELVQQNALEKRPTQSLKTLPMMISAHRFGEAEQALLEYFEEILQFVFVEKVCLLQVKQQMLESIAKLNQTETLAVEMEELRRYSPTGVEDVERLRQICCGVCRALQYQSQQTSEQQAQQESQTILDWIEKHLCDETLSLSYLAEAFRLSESKMSRQIKQLTGDTFLNYVHQKRIAHACHLIKNTDMTIGQIAKASGYESDITFRRLFKKYTGITPGEYRTEQQ